MGSDPQQLASKHGAAMMNLGTKSEMDKTNFKTTSLSLPVSVGAGAACYQGRRRGSQIEASNLPG